MKRSAVLHPVSGADGAGGLTAEVGGAFVFDQDGGRAADGGSSYRHCQNIMCQCYDSKKTYFMLFSSQLIYYQSLSFFSNSYFLISPKSSYSGETNQNQMFAPPQRCS